jgi:hypothetical protein
MIITLTGEPVAALDGAELPPDVLPAAALVPVLELELHAAAALSSIAATAANTIG